MNCLCISVLSPLNDQRHHPGRDSSHCVPIECVRVEDSPEDGIRKDNQKRCRSSRPHPEVREGVSKSIL